MDHHLYGIFAKIFGTWWTFFYKNSLSDFHRNQQDLSSNCRIKQVRVGLLARIQMLQDSIVNCTKINDKRSNAFLKALEIVKYLKGPQLVRESMLIPKEQLEIELNIIKASWTSEFDNLIDFPKEEIKWWLVTFVNDNEDHLASVENFHFQFKEMGEEIFSLLVKKDITVPPMKEYIEEWLKISLIQIVNSK